MLKEYYSQVSNRRPAN